MKREEETWRERRRRDEEEKMERWRGGGEREKVRRLERKISNHIIWYTRSRALYIVHTFNAPVHDAV